MPYFPSPLRRLLQVAIKFRKDWKIGISFPNHTCTTDDNRAVIVRSSNDRITVFVKKGKADSRNGQSFSLPLLLTTKSFGLKTKELTNISVRHSRQNLSYQLEKRIRILTPKRNSCYLFFSKLVHTDTQINRWQKRLNRVVLLHSQRNTEKEHFYRI